MANMGFGVNILPKTNNTYSLGNSDHKWNLYVNEINGTAFSSLIPDVSGFYTKPSGGIPASDLADTYLTAATEKWSEYTIRLDTTTGSNSLSVLIKSNNNIYYKGASQTPTNGQIAMYDNSAYLNSTTPSSGDSSTKVATTAFVDTYFAPKANPEFTGSISLGRRTIDTGTNAFTCGYNLTATGDYSTAIGYSTSATGEAAHAEGVSYEGAYTAPDGISRVGRAAGKASHTEGYYTGADGVAAHAEGNQTFALGPQSHSEGILTIAGGQAAHTNGRGTIATGAMSWVGGVYNVYESANAWTANTSYSVGDKVLYNHALRKCKTANSDSSFDETKWTYNATWLFQIGNGTAESRSNALTITSDGNGLFNGDLYVNCDADSTNGDKVATESYVTTAIANASIGGGGGTASVFTGATSSVAGTAGLVPAPTTSDVNKFLRGDGTWATPVGGITGITLVSTSLTPSNGVVTIPAMTACSSSAAGATGAVPAPAAGDEDKFLSGDGTWKAGGLPMVILSYGNSTWQSFIDAYKNNVIVYARASSNSNPASGSQTRMAFMAYVNNATNPTNVEFQYYRSVNPTSKSMSQLCDQVFIYKLDKTSGWSVTTREACIKSIEFAANTGLTGTFTTSNGKLTISATS